MIISTSTLKPSDALTAARQLITPPECWTQNAYARAANNAVVLPDADNAVCFCSIGAISKITGHDLTFPTDLSLPVDYLLTAVQSRANVLGLRQNISITSFNDTRRHKDVLEAFDLAITLAKQAGQ